MWELVDKDDIKFSFMPALETSEAIFILRQLGENHLAKRKDLYFTFIDMEKAFDWVSNNNFCWAKKK